MRYATYSGGKRLRPALVFAAAHAVGLAPERAAPLASAVELVHTYSLVHDDLPAMDDDDERRGRPTVHVKFGEANAILVGDALLAAAFGALAAADAPRRRGRQARRTPRARARWSEARSTTSPSRPSARARSWCARSTSARPPRCSASRCGRPAPSPAAPRASSRRSTASGSPMGSRSSSWTTSSTAGATSARSCASPTRRPRARACAREVETALAIADSFGAAGAYLRGLASASAGRLR